MIEQLQNDIKDAMRAKAASDLNVLRALKNEITNAALRKGNVNEALSNIEILAIVRKEISKRQDSIDAFITGGREELADKEQMEIEVLAKYLPEEMSDGHLETIINLIILEIDNPTKKDMGKIIKNAVEIVNGRADNKRISAMVGQKLA